MKLKFHPIMILAATSLVCVVVSGTSIVSAQEVEVEVEETTIEATIPGEAIPEESITIDDPNIEISDLKLLVKPLTLEELQHEGAAWLFLLKDKTREISNAEIAIKRENRKIDKEKQSIKSLKNAQKQVLEAEKAQAKANQNNKGKEEAAKKVQKAKEALKAAEASMEEVREDHDKLEADEIQQKWVREAQEKRVIIEARAILEKAKIIRQDVADDSPQYEKVTDKIDALEESINALEKTEASLIGKIPGSSKYKNVKGKISQAREAVKNATLDLVKIMPGLEIDPDSSFSLTGAAIAQDTSENLDHNTEHNEHQIAPPPSNLDHVEEHLDTDHLDESEGHKLDQQLEEIDEELEHHAEEEAKVKNQLVANATKLQAQQTTIIDRFNVILDELDAKGGETVGYRKYIDAINGIEIDLTDLEGLRVRLLSWLKSEEGGILWGKNLTKFLGILLASAIAARLLSSSVNRVLVKVGGVSSLFRHFIVMVVERSVFLVGVLLALTSLGVSLGPVVALLGGASFVLAFALQSNLGNFASGLMLLINKPFDVGDEIKVAGYWAYVDSISLASTKIKDFSGNIITLPNNTVWGGEITNYTHADIRKVSLSIHVEFQQDLDQIQDMWMEITAAHPKVLDAPKSGAFAWNTHYDYYIPIGLSAWSKTEDYWSVYGDLLKELQKQLQSLNIELAAPQEVG